MIHEPVWTLRATRLMLWLLLALSVAMALSIGPFQINLATVREDPMAWQLLVDVRLPRVLAAAMAGAVLAVSGVAMQSLFRNALVEPGLVGVSAGGALGAALVVLAGVGVWSLSGAAFVGALLVSLAIWGFGRRFGGGPTLLLVGIAWNALAAAMIGLLQALAPAQSLQLYAIWSLGGFGQAQWLTVLPMLLAGLLSLLGLLGLGEALNVLSLGRREAKHLGIGVNWLEARILVCVALGVGAATAVIGFMVFVGLVVPHLLRLLLGPDHRHLLPYCALAGATLLVFAELFARVAIAPRELPVGVVTSLIGGPLFFILLWRSRSGVTT